jgi:hypothetical protein
MPCMMILGPKENFRTQLHMHWNTTWETYSLIHCFLK